jgi:hypothetical protein
LTGESSNEHKDEREREVNEDIVAVHGWYLLDPVILALKLVSPDLIFVGAVFVGFSFGVERDTPAARHHLSAHFAVFGGAQRHVGKVRLFHCFLFDTAGIDLEPFSEVIPSLLDCVIFTVWHTTILTTPLDALFRVSGSYFDSKYRSHATAQRRNGTTFTAFFRCAAAPLREIGLFTSNLRIDAVTTPSQ